MCWNAIVSMNTFLFSLFITIISYYNNILTLPVAIYYASFFGIQLVEYFIWKGYNNRLFSLLGLLLILSQPIFALLIIKESNIKMGFISLYVIMCVIYYLMNSPINLTTTIAKNGHLKWNWLNVNMIFIFIWFAFILVSIVYSGSRIGIIFITASFLISLYMYYQAGTFGSMWCWIANLVFVYLFYLIVKKSLLCY